MGDRKQSPETKLVLAMIDYIRKQGHHAWRNNTGARQIKGQWVQWGAKGSGDILVVVQPNGRFLSIEVKAGRNKATKNQEEWIAKVKQAGAVAGVARSFADVDEFLAEAALETPSIF
ncbi:hypothetical protein LCGC14_1651140 [marine sediment metagenome]|uniref:VRR-NUC domain-containing protein n=1 Tax=marine sediment metagenome TaxID=412755 RepID=A0A0F9HWT1_9ZZZZ